MNYIIDYFIFIISKIIDILDGIKLPGSLSLLQYLLGAIIISFIFKLIKGGSTEFEQNTNFLNGRIITGYAASAKYGNSNKDRRTQIVKQSKSNNNLSYINQNEQRIQEVLGTMSQSELEERWRSHGVNENLIRLSRGDD